MSNASAERVLIVEDEPSTRLGLTELVRTWGFTAESAADGEEALHSVTTFRPSIIITDLVMPRMGGLDLLKALKQDDGGCTVREASRAPSKPSRRARTTT
jgi:CheY-like chemotaxis protein